MPSGLEVVVREAGLSQLKPEVVRNIKAQYYHWWNLLSFPLCGYRNVFTCNRHLPQTG